MNPAMIAMIAQALTETLRFAMDGADLIRQANAGELDADAAEERWAAMNRRYAAARKAWDDAA